MTLAGNRGHGPRTPRLCTVQILTFLLPNTRWYYFSVGNTRARQNYKFNVINLLKPDSLYNRGMQPLIYSNRAAAESGKAWRRCGQRICYYQNHIKRKGSSNNYYTATFTLDFEYDNDTVYIAYCYPYTFTDLQRYLRSLELDPKRRNRFRRRTLCQTLAGNNVGKLKVAKHIYV